MKDLIVLFIYELGSPYTVGGDPDRNSVGLDINDGKAYDLCFYDDDVEPCCIAECLSVGRELSYDQVRILAQRAYANGGIQDASKYDSLSESNWREFISDMPQDYHYVVDDDGGFRMLRMSDPI